MTAPDGSIVPDEQYANEVALLRKRFQTFPPGKEIKLGRGGRVISRTHLGGNAWEVVEIVESFRLVIACGPNPDEA